MSKPATKAAAPPNTPKSTYDLHDKVLILANGKVGTVKALFVRVGQMGQNCVEYVSNDGVVHEAWFPGDELATPKPAKKPAAKA